MIAYIIITLIWCIPMILYIIWRRIDWYLFLFPLFVSLLFVAILDYISEVLSTSFSMVVLVYIIYKLTNKEAREINNKIKREREEIYKEYKKDIADNQMTFKNYILPSGKKVEFIDFNTKTFYLLRPYAEDVDKKYKKEIHKYVSELEAVYGEVWSWIIDIY